MSLYLVDRFINDVKSVHTKKLVDNSSLRYRLSLSDR